MAQNKIEDLNNHLFAALERLNDEEVIGEKLKEEVERAKAIANVGSKVIDVMKVQVDFYQTLFDNGYTPEIPEQLKKMLPNNNQ